MPIVSFILTCFHPLMFHFYIVNLDFISTMATLSPFNFCPFLNAPFIHLYNFLWVSSIQYITNPFLSINIVCNTIQENTIIVICHNGTIYAPFMIIPQLAQSTHIWVLILDKILASFVWFKLIYISLVSTIHPRLYSICTIPN